MLSHRPRTYEVTASTNAWALINAVKARDQQVVKHLLDEGVDPNRFTGDTTALIEAAKDHCGPYNSYWDKGYAVPSEDESFVILKLLLNGGADANIIAGNTTALIQAVKCGNRQAVKELLEKGADANIIAGDITALIQAVEDHCGLYVSYWDNVPSEDESFVILKLLLNGGADVNMLARDSTIDILVEATHFWHMDPELVKLLLGKGANVNIIVDDTTLLIESIKRGSVEIVKLLLDRGADVNIEADGTTALIEAVCACALYKSNNNKEPELLSMLLSQKPDVTRVAEYSRTALIAAICELPFRVEGSRRQGWEWNFLQNVLLAVPGVKDYINVAGWKYGNALMAAVTMKKPQLFELLIERGADANEILDSHNYESAMGAAVAAGLDPEISCEMVRELIKNGADIHAASCGQFGSILGKASYFGATRLVLSLLELGADPFYVGGRYAHDQAAPGRYANALDAAESSGSKAGPDLCAILSRAIKSNSRTETTPPRPPFPMPCICLSTIFEASMTSANIYPKAPVHSMDWTTVLTLTSTDNISAQHADVSCTAINQEVLVQALVQLVMGIKSTTTSDFKRYEDLIRNDVQYFINQNYDFGLAYAAARIGWKHFNEPDFLPRATPCLHREVWYRIAEHLGKARENSIEEDGTGQKMITRPYNIMPRRLWDLKSNRIVDYRILRAELLATKWALSTQFNMKAKTTDAIFEPSTFPTYWAITHSWESTMNSVNTPINQYQWQVPFPHGFEIDHLRQQLLSYDIEYAWLDVLCLRQQTLHTKTASILNNIQKEEWRLDVPTIGNIYRAAKGIVRYFNGVGRGFKNDGWDDDRHWLQRAWTLQEITKEALTINGGILTRHTSIGTTNTPNIMNIKGTIGGRTITLRRALRPILKLAMDVDSPDGCSLYGLAREMCGRKSTNDLDKVAGVLYLLRLTQLPAYDDGVSAEEAWTKCFHVLPFRRKLELLFDFPYRGRQHWFPEWTQLLEWPKIDPDADYNPAAQAEGHRQLVLTQSKNNEALRGLFVSDIWGISSSRITLRTSATSNDYEVDVDGRIYGFYWPYISKGTSPDAAGGFLKESAGTRAAGSKESIDEAAVVQQPLDLTVGNIFTLATPDLGPSYNWVLCEFLRMTKGGCTYRLTQQEEETNQPQEEQASLNVDIEVLRKIGVLRTDFCGEMLAATKGGRALRRINALFV